MNRKRLFQLIFIIAFVVLVGNVKNCYAIPNPDWFFSANNDTVVYCELGANFRVDVTAKDFNSISVSDTADHSIATVDLKSEGAYAYQLPGSCSESDNCATVHVNCKSVGSTTFDISGFGTNDDANSSKTKRISIVVVEDPEGDMTKKIASFVTLVSNGSSNDLGDTIDEECIVGSKSYKYFTFNRTSLWNGEWQSNQNRVSSSNSSIASVTLGNSLSTTVGWIEVDCKSAGTSQITVGPFITAIKTAGYYSRAGEYVSLAGLAPHGRVYTSNLKMNVTVRENISDFSVTPEEITISVGETSGVSATQTGTVQVNTFPTYYSSNPQVATVDNRTGKVTGVSEGEATITAKYGSIVAGTTHVVVVGGVEIEVPDTTMDLSITQIIIGIILTLIGLSIIFYFEHRKKNS